MTEKRPPFVFNDSQGRQISILNDGLHHNEDFDVGYKHDRRIGARTISDWLPNHESSTPSSLSSSSYNRQTELSPRPGNNALSPHSQHYCQPSNYFNSYHDRQQLSSPRRSPPLASSPSLEIHVPSPSADSPTSSLSSSVFSQASPVYSAPSPASSLGSSSCAPTARSEKRYPCKFRHSLGCTSTFTTSGHASRHSNKHTREKMVQCTHSGCPKSFTRADNMQQHLRTHRKAKESLRPTARYVGMPGTAKAPRSNDSTPLNKDDDSSPLSLPAASEKKSLHQDSIQNLLIASRLVFDKAPET